MYIYIYVYNIYAIYSKTSPNRPTMDPILNGSCREVVGLAYVYNIYIYIYIYVYSKTSPNRPTMDPILSGSCREVVGLGS